MDNEVTLLLIVPRPVERLVTRLVTLLSDVESDVTPVDVDADSEFRFVESVLTFPLVKFEAVERLSARVATVLRLAETTPTTLLVVLRPVNSAFTVLDWLASELLAVFKPVDIEFVALLSVLTLLDS